VKRIFLFILLAVVVAVYADDYVDDVYFTPDMAVSDASSASAQALEPYYDLKNMEEIVFYTDSVATPGSAEEPQPAETPLPAESTTDESTIEIHRK